VLPWHHRGVTDLVRYRSPDEDSARWEGFEFRDGDIVISTRSKTGTTWIQMICALLIFQSPELPEPLWRSSPWLDWLITGREEVYSLLRAQRHRRFIKSHTPLDGIPSDPRVTYIVAARHPLDVAVSLYHQSLNIDRGRLRQLTTRNEPERGLSAAKEEEGATLPPLRDWLVEWIDWDPDPRENLDSLPGFMLHLSDAWDRRTRGNVVLVHYDDLCEDLERQMRCLAVTLGISVEEELWPALVGAATFTRMRSRSHETVPDPSGILKDRSAFFRRGSSGSGTGLLTTAELAGYHTKVSRLAQPDLLAWLHRS
jgi:aryl sulfotransferase